jgi:hypothetical protein
MTCVTEFRGPKSYFPKVLAPPTKKRSAIEGPDAAAGESDSDSPAPRKRTKKVVAEPSARESTARARAERAAKRAKKAEQAQLAVVVEADEGAAMPAAAVAPPAAAKGKQVVHVVEDDGPVGALARGISCFEIQSLGSSCSLSLLITLNRGSSQCADCGGRSQRLPGLGSHPDPGRAHAWPLSQPCLEAATTPRTHTNERVWTLPRKARHRRPLSHCNL